MHETRFINEIFVVLKQKLGEDAFSGQVDEAPKTASSYDIMSIPTLAVFKNGKVVDRILGALPKAELETTIKKHI